MSRAILKHGSSYLSLDPCLVTLEPIGSTVVVRFRIVIMTRMRVAIVDEKGINKCGSRNVSPRTASAKKRNCLAWFLVVRIVLLANDFYHFVWQATFYAVCRLDCIVRRGPSSSSVWEGSFRRCACLNRACLLKQLASLFK